MDGAVWFHGTIENMPDIAVPPAQCYGAGRLGLFKRFIRLNLCPPTATVHPRSRAEIQITPMEFLTIKVADVR